MTDDITDTSTRPIPTRHVITCWCGRSWRVDGASSFACLCGMRFWGIRTEPTFRFNIEEPTMSDDLPERLRIPHPIDSRHDSRDPLCPCFTCKQRRQAADEIDWLRAKVERLESRGTIAEQADEIDRLIADLKNTLSKAAEGWR